MELPTPQVPVLDHGFVQLVSLMDGDAGVVDAARVCYGSAKDPESDRKLVRYLMEHEHMTPFEHAVFKFHIKAPLFIARQWFRHRSSSYNEESQRYKVVDDHFYYPARWRAQSATDKQGSIPAPLLDHQLETDRLRHTCGKAMDEYHAALDRGVAKEMARMHLPTNVYTQWYWTVNARNLMAFIKLRSEHHAQWEMRQYSNTIWPLLARSMPWSAEAFLGTLSLSRYGALDGVAGPNISDVLEATR